MPLMEKNEIQLSNIVAGLEMNGNQLFYTLYGSTGN